MNKVNIHTPVPSGIGDPQVRALFNNSQANALALGDPRGAMKRGNLIRPGVSIGRGQMNQAGIQGANEMANAIADAYAQNLQQHAYNADVKFQGEQANEQFAQALGGLQQQNAYNRQADALQRQGAMMGFASNLLGGLLR